MAIVGKKAPHFSCKAVADGGDFIENFLLNSLLEKKECDISFSIHWILLLFVQRKSWRFKSV